MGSYRRADLDSPGAVVKGGREMDNDRSPVGECAVHGSRQGRGRVEDHQIPGGQVSRQVVEAAVRHPEAARHAHAHLTAPDPRTSGGSTADRGSGSSKSVSAAGKRLTT
jgi:hypothetical protein